MSKISTIFKFSLLGLLAHLPRKLPYSLYNFPPFPSRCHRREFSVRHRPERNVIWAWHIYSIKSDGRGTIRAFKSRTATHVRQESLRKYLRYANHIHTAVVPIPLCSGRNIYKLSWRCIAEFGLVVPEDKFLKF